MPSTIKGSGGQTRDCGTNRFVFQGGAFSGTCNIGTGVEVNEVYDRVCETNNRTFYVVVVPANPASRCVEARRLGSLIDRRAEFGLKAVLAKTAPLFKTAVRLVRICRES